MDIIASALDSIPALVWGDRAIAALGVGLVCDHYMLVINDIDIERASQQLRSAGFLDCTWSCGSLHPDFYQGPLRQNIYRRITHHYSNFDRNSSRFLFPSESQATAKVVLLPSSYAHVGVTWTLDEALTRDGNITYPDGSLLLKNIVQTLVREPVQGMWTSCLGMWAITYVYGELILDDDVLDSCTDEEAKCWFHEKIHRDSGGIDRVTCTKRLGRLGYDEALARNTTA
ncbi:hypothetical protein V8C35DRAFT_285114 [Trichoderma chlorosporum]